MKRPPDTKESDSPVGCVELGIHGSRKAIKRSRPVIVVPVAGGELREVSAEDLLAGLVKKTAVEIAGRSDYIVCSDCGQPRKCAKRGKAPVRCVRCKHLHSRTTRDRANYNEYQREYMRARYARMKAEKKETA